MDNFTFWKYSLVFFNSLIICMYVITIVGEIFIIITPNRQAKTVLVDQKT